MCRLFGFRSVVVSQVHKSLVGAENALLQQSQKHPHGWGVAYYINKAPHIIRSLTSARECSLFRQVSGVVSSQTVMAHLRKATMGDHSVLNTHPFQYGSWTFAHNGNVKGFEQHKETLVSMIHPELRRFILGDTDSEVLFYMLLTEINRQTALISSNVSSAVISEAVNSFIAKLTKIIGPPHDVDDGPSEETYISFLITNGTTFAGFHGGQTLHSSTYKSKCPDSGTCPHYAPECENPTESGFVNHLVFSSEVLEGVGVWHKMKRGQLIVVDPSMHLHEEFIDI